MSALTGSASSARQTVRMRRALLYVGGWLAAVVVATAVGFAAVGLVGGDVGAGSADITLVTDPITPTPASSTPLPHRTSTPIESGRASNQPASSGVSAPRLATQVTRAGSMTVRCSSGAHVVSYAPKNGWSVIDAITTGPTRQVVFGNDTEYVRIHVRCTPSGPVFDVDTSTATSSPSPSPTPSETVSVQSQDTTK